MVGEVGDVWLEAVAVDDVGGVDDVPLVVVPPVGPPPPPAVPPPVVPPPEREGKRTL